MHRQIATCSWDQDQDAFSASVGSDATVIDQFDAFPYSDAEIHPEEDVSSNEDVAPPARPKSAKGPKPLLGPSKDEIRAHYARLGKKPPRKARVKTPKTVVEQPAHDKSLKIYEALEKRLEGIEAAVQAPKQAEKAKDEKPVTDSLKRIEGELHGRSVFRLCMAMMIAGAFVGMCLVEIF